MGAQNCFTFKPSNYQNVIDLYLDELCPKITSWYWTFYKILWSVCRKAPGCPSVSPRLCHQASLCNCAYCFMLFHLSLLHVSRGLPLLLLVCFFFFFAVVPLHCLSIIIRSMCSGFRRMCPRHLYLRLSISSWMFILPFSFSFFFILNFVLPLDF